MSKTWHGHERSWRWYFGELLRAHEGYKLRPNRLGGISVASHRTREKTHDDGILVIGILRDRLGFKVKKPAGLEPKHMEALARWMNGAREKRDLLPATLAGYATVIRKIVVWAGKPRLVAVFERHLKRETTARHLAADYDKSFEGAGLDSNEAIERAWQVEPWVAMALVVAHVFGGRRREVVCLAPIIDIDFDGGVVHLRYGKGGRKRVVPIRNEDDRAVCELLLDFIRWRNYSEGLPPNAPTSLAPNSLSQEQAVWRYANVLRALGYTRAALGATGHGLRAGYACRRLQELGIAPVVRGGCGKLADPRLTQLRLTMVAEAMGHSRPGIGAAYAGAPGVMDRVIASEYLRERGLLLPGRDARSIDVNAQRISDFLSHERSLIAAEVAARKRGEAANAGSQNPPEVAASAAPDAVEPAGQGKATSSVVQAAQTPGMTDPSSSVPLVPSIQQADAPRAGQQEQ